MRGEAFLDAYTRGDNRLVVATDTMKNFIHAASLDSTATTLEGWLHHVGSRFLAEYPHMERLTMLGRELPFPAALVPADDGDGWAESEVLFARDRNDRSTASLDLERDGGGGVIVSGHACGRRDLQLIKVTGSAFADFARDEHTTLPERRDRPLYIWTDIGWRYADASDALGTDPARYVDGQQVSDLAGAVFHQFVSLSIQHLVHEIGLRMLERWPQLDEVSFEATNRLWDPGAVSETDERIKTYADPRPPYRAHRPGHASVSATRLTPEDEQRFRFSSIAHGEMAIMNPLSGTVLNEAISELELTPGHAGAGSGLRQGGGPAPDRGALRRAWRGRRPVALRHRAGACRLHGAAQGHPRADRGRRAAVRAAVELRRRAGAGPGLGATTASSRSSARPTRMRCPAGCCCWPMPTGAPSRPTSTWPCSA